jgi:hypothetical protein
MPVSFQRDMLAAGCLQQVGTRLRSIFLKACYMLDIFMISFNTHTLEKESFQFFCKEIEAEGNYKPLLRSEELVSGKA